MIYEKGEEKKIIFEEEKEKMKRIFAKFGLCDDAINVLVEGAVGIYDEIYDEKAHFAIRHQTGQIAFKLACDKKACAIKFLDRKVVSLDQLTKARRLTGIEKILDPKERVPAQIKMLVRNKWIQQENAPSMEYGAKHILDEYQEKTGKTRTSSNACIDASASIYIASMRFGKKIPQNVFRQFFGISEPALKNAYRELANELGLDRELLIYIK